MARTHERTDHLPQNRFLFGEARLPCLRGLKGIRNRCRETEADAERIRKDPAAGKGLMRKRKKGGWLLKKTAKE